MRCLINNPLLKKNKDHNLLSIFRKVGFIGDSLSSGELEGTDENGNKTFHDYYEYSWGQFIARRCGLEAYNFSQGGLKAISFFEMIKNENLNPFSEQKKCQAYFIALGVNDVNHLDEYKDGFGSFDDVDFTNEDNNKKSYIGQYVRIIQKLRKLEPKCRIFVVTTPKEVPENKTQKKYFDAIRKFLLELQNYFTFLYTIDLRKYGPRYNEKFRYKYFLGGHMSTLGYKYTADMIIKYTDYIIEHHIEDFAQTGFIGKGGVHNAYRKW